MIAGYFHQGSGLGNQLFRYVTVRTLAADKGYKYYMYSTTDDSGKEKDFKGQSFMRIDWNDTNGPPVPFATLKQWNEKKVVENGVDIRGYDPEINFVEDYTIIEGEFQDERYWGHRLNDIREWLKVEPLAVADDVCLIGFRGGEYATVPDLFLPHEYWDICIEKMLAINPNMVFHVVTDDPVTAAAFFPNFSITHDVEMDWKKIRYAKYAIVANSSFYILPRLLNEKPGRITLAPRYWARRNTKTWALPQNYYSAFTYV